MAYSSSLYQKAYEWMDSGGKIGDSGLPLDFITFLCKEGQISSRLQTLLHLEGRFLLGYDDSAEFNKIGNINNTN